MPKKWLRLFHRSYQILKVAAVPEALQRNVVLRPDVAAGTDNLLAHTLVAPVAFVNDNSAPDDSSLSL